MLELAIQQITGFCTCKDGYSVRDLIEGMGLTEEEYLEIKNKNEIHSKSFIEDADEHFNEFKQRDE